MAAVVVAVPVALADAAWAASPPTPQPDEGNGRESRFFRKGISLIVCFNEEGENDELANVAATTVEVVMVNVRGRFSIDSN